MSSEVPRFHVAPIAEADTYDLRRRVSADGFVLASWHLEFDGIPGARYLGAVSVDERRIIGTVSLYPAAFPSVPETNPWIRFMFMAVDPEFQRCGIGTALTRTIFATSEARGHNFCGPRRGT